MKTSTEPNENQVEKHSAEPWITGEMLKHVVYDANAIVACDCGHRSNAECSDANAARIVACVNFCAGIHIETLTLLNQANHPTLQQICERNQSLEAELSTLRKELEAARIAAGIRYSSVTLESEIQYLMAEADKVVKLQRELEAAKKAQEWLKLHSPIILKALQSYIGNPCETAYELRELLNSGKDGK